MDRTNPLSLQAAIGDLLRDENVRREVEAEAQALIAASDLLVELDRLRELYGLTKADLARRAGLKPSNLRKILSAGTGRLELLTYLKLIGALGHQVELSALATNLDTGATRIPSKRAEPARTSKRLNPTF
jgi:DNA-binding phage protein